MGPDRLKGFTDGVLAIVITIMVLELHAPHDTSFAALRPLVTDAPLRHRTGVAMRARAEAEFDQERMFQTYAALIEVLL